MITLNKIESQIVYYCKGWFKGRNDPYSDMKQLAAQWAGVDGPSNNRDTCFVLMQILDVLRIREDQWRSIISDVVNGGRFSDTTDPFERFVNKFIVIVGEMQVIETKREVLIRLEPLDLTVL